MARHSAHAPNVVPAGSSTRPSQEPAALVWPPPAQDIDACEVVSLPPEQQEAAEPRVIGTPEAPAPLPTPPPAEVPIDHRAPSLPPVLAEAPIDLSEPAMPAPVPRSVAPSGARLRLVRSLRFAMHGVAAAALLAASFFAGERAVGHIGHLRATWTATMKSFNAVLARPDGARSTVAAAATEARPVSIVPPAVVNTKRHTPAPARPTSHSTALPPPPQARRPAVAGWISVTSDVPVVVSEGGEVLGSSGEGRVAVRAGRHRLTFTSSPRGIRFTRTIEVPRHGTAFVRLVRDPSEPRGAAPSAPSNHVPTSVEQLRRRFAEARDTSLTKRYTEAARMLAALAADPILANATEGELADLRRSIEDFRQLAESSASASAAASPVGATVPPVARSQAIPEPVGPVVVRGGQRAVLEILIDERGRVERATIRESLNPFYDAKLIAASHGWRFDPARRDGQPIKFLRRMEIVVKD